MSELAQNLCVVITRPSAQAEPWAAHLAQQGFATTFWNLLEISAVTGEEQIRSIKNKILNFDLYQKVIFVSQNAVDHAMQWLEDYWPQLPIGIEYFAIGATTANKLSVYGVPVQDLAVVSRGGMTSEDLLTADQLQNVDGEKILIFRGRGGRGYLAEELTKRGARVDFCELYERKLPFTASEQLAQLMSLPKDTAKEVAEKQPIIALHSGESLQNMQIAAAQLPDAAQAEGWLKQQILLVPSRRIADDAQAAGFTRTICAENATDDAMTAALLHYCRTQTCISLQD